MPELRKKLVPKKENKSEIGLCSICSKDSGKYKQGCDVLTYKIGEHNECTCFTDDRYWEVKVNRQVMRYAMMKGERDYIPIGQ